MDEDVDPLDLIRISEGERAAGGGEFDQELEDPEAGDEASEGEDEFSEDDDNDNDGDEESSDQDVEEEDDESDEEEGSEYENVNDFPLATAVTRETIRNLPTTLVEKAGEECMICVSDLAVDNIIITLPCKHYFHEDCLVPWLLHAGTCPACRRVLPKHNEHHHNARIKSEEREVPDSRRTSLAEARVTMDWEVADGASLTVEQEGMLEEDLD
ncbi:hypothetical protein BDZ85DRAFT_286051 [Elsinoe ampelina]|uniref:RING-type domain-containing protein n=1 Tax=Elsinoe ampelina TaxID=302913 RepID=A0A6A6FZ17_9PEZI|nr:hypothetical protein BDZ85DRAFT_286051 [Elsinoe ampelina]